MSHGVSEWQEISYRLVPSIKSSSSAWTQVLASGEMSSFCIEVKEDPKDRWARLGQQDTRTGEWLIFPPVPSGGRHHWIHSWSNTELAHVLIYQSLPLKAWHSVPFTTVPTHTPSSSQGHSLIFPQGGLMPLLMLFFVLCCCSFSKPHLTFKAHLWFFLLGGAFPKQFHPHLTSAALALWPHLVPVLPSLGCTCIVLRVQDPRILMLQQAPYSACASSLYLLPSLCVWVLTLQSDGKLLEGKTPFSVPGAPYNAHLGPMSFSRIWCIFMEGVKN